jgi:hypothetical protein
MVCVNTWASNEHSTDSVPFPVLMTDPAVAYVPGENYGPYDRGTAADIWLKAENGSASLGVVWPGTYGTYFLNESYD